MNYDLIVRAKTYCKSNKTWQSAKFIPFVYVICMKCHLKYKQDFFVKDPSSNITHIEEFHTRANFSFEVIKQLENYFFWEDAKKVWIKS